MRESGFEDSLFQCIATLIHDQQQAARANRRGEERHAYQCVQLVAPYNGERLPEQDEFSFVMCHDLSPNGFSYLTDKRPVSQHLIVALGKVPFKFLIAEIVRVAPQDSSLELMIRVGCRFVGRISEG